MFKRNLFLFIATLLQTEKHDIGHLPALTRQKSVIGRFKTFGLVRNFSSKKLRTLLLKLRKST